MGVFAFSDAYYENDEPSEIESVDEQGNFDIDSDTFDANLGAEAGAEKFGVGRTLNFWRHPRGSTPPINALSTSTPIDEP